MEIQILAVRHNAGSRGGLGVGPVADHGSVFQGSRGFQQSLGLGGVLHAGKLHHDTVGPLALHQRLRYTQLVHTIAQSRQVLSHREIEDALGFLLGQVQAQGAGGLVG